MPQAVVGGAPGTNEPQCALSHDMSALREVLSAVRNTSEEVLFAGLLHRAAVWQSSKALQLYTGSRMTIHILCAILYP